MKTLRLFLLFVLLGLNLKVCAHEIRPAYLQLVQIDETSFEIYWKVPMLGDLVPKINPVFPSGFQLESLNLPNRTAGSVIYSYRLTSDKTLAGQQLYIDGLNKTLIDALLTITYLNGETVSVLLQPDKDTIIIPGESKLIDIIQTYTILGIEHILLGIDHLLFVLALILIVKGNWKIIKTVTAFTLAHSITLSAAALGLVFIPGPPVEAVIALSIVFLALEIVANQNGKETLTSKQPWIVAFTFGLLHGFGFAGALSDIGLPQQNIPWALGFFNVGVELGQILFILVVLGILRILAIYKNWSPKLKLVPPYLIGSIACFWLVERILSFFN
ncbi:HupE/UreJ family protein [Algoriphagus sediminis]|uniref:HupE/UreJ family protein n=1 Tax=Algoriphagus sediminis TaxID=3057113 RepID=A0ABT7YDB9_9BACT|nr:HupE/UreJ family protein [Algoriphagus sediminis]MDN3204528.1 HupE/UreJ family protein [Algoriphagus sediminis]